MSEERSEPRRVEINGPLPMTDGSYVIQTIVQGEGIISVAEFDTFEEATSAMDDLVKVLIKSPMSLTTAGTDSSET